MDLSNEKISKVFSEVLRNLPIEKDNDLKDIYEENYIEDMVENDGISAAEAGFMIGYYED